jgi:hypothetical protein
VLTRAGRALPRAKYDVPARREAFYGALLAPRPRAARRERRRLGAGDSVQRGWDVQSEATVEARRAAARHEPVVLFQFVTPGYFLGHRVPRAARGG